MEDDGRRQWDFVIGRAFVAAVEAPAAAAVLASLQALVSERSITPELVIGVIPVETVGSFSVVTWGTSDSSSEVVTVCAIVRGDAAVDVDSVGGSRRFSDGGIRPWNLAEFTDVVSMTLTDRDAPLAEQTAVWGRAPAPIGTQRATRLDWIPGGAHRGFDELDTPMIGDAAPLEQTILRQRADGEDAIADADTIRRGTFRAERSRTAPEPGPIHSDPAPNLAVRVGGDDAVPIDRPILIGRRPALPRVPDRIYPHLITVSSPTNAISSTHLEIRIEGRSVVATDLRSTNGTVVSAGHGGRRRLRPGESVVVGPTTCLDIGDGTIVEIVAMDCLPSRDIDRKRPE